MPNRSRNPFTAFQVELAFYLLDADDLPYAELYAGGCVERLTMSLEYEGQEWKLPGEPYADEIPVNEMHRLVLENLWLHEREDDGTARMPQLTPTYTRNVRFCMVAIWFDADLFIWNKRTYFGVRLQRHELGNTQHFQTTNWFAASMAEKTGLGAKPSINPDNLAVVVYIKAAETTILYTYDFDAKVFTPTNTALLPTRATLTPGSGTFTITFHGTPALILDGTGLHVQELQANGSSFVDGAEPTERLEFRIGALRVATLAGDGRLAMADFEEGGDPVLAGDLEFRSAGHGWLGSFAPGKGYATELNEPLP